MKDEKKNMDATIVETAAEKPELADVAAAVARDVKDDQAQFADKKVSLTAAVIWGFAACIVTFGATLHAVNRFGLAEVVNALPQQAEPTPAASALTAVAAVFDVVCLVLLVAKLAWNSRREGKQKNKNDKE